MEWDELEPDKLALLEDACVTVWGSDSLGLRLGEVDADGADEDGRGGEDSGGPELGLVQSWGVRRGDGFMGTPSGDVSTVARSVVGVLCDLDDCAQRCGANRCVALAPAARLGSVSRPQRLHALDAIFLPMETSTQSLHVGSVLILKGEAPTPAALPRPHRRRGDESAASRTAGDAHAARPGPADLGGRTRGRPRRSRAPHATAASRVTSSSCALWWATS